MNSFAILFVGSFLFIFGVIPYLFWFFTKNSKNKYDTGTILIITLFFILLFLSLLTGTFSFMILIGTPFIFISYYYAYHKNKLHWFKQLIHIIGVVYMVVLFIIPFDIASRSFLYGLSIPIGIGFFFAGLYRQLFFYFLITVTFTFGSAFILKNAGGINVNKLPVNPALFLMLFVIIVGSLIGLSKSKKPLYKKTEDKLKEDLKNDNYKMPSDLFFDYFDKKFGKKDDKK